MTSGAVDVSAGAAGAVDVSAGAAAVHSVASSLGIQVTGLETLHAGSNVSFLLRPAELVARVVGLVGGARLERGLPDAERDVAVARWLAMRGGPVVRPSEDPPAGPHRVADAIVSLWAFERITGTGWDDPIAAGASLRRVHGQLRAPDAPDVPALPIWHDAARWLGRGRFLPAAERSWLQELHVRLSERIAGLGLPEQVLHGDAHPRNLWLTPRGPVWADFEETGRWPVEWDLACVLAFGSSRDDALVTRAMVEAYGRDPDDPLLEPFLLARNLMIVAWLGETGMGPADVTERIARRIAWLRERA